MTLATSHFSVDPTALLTWLTCIPVMLGTAIAILRWGRKFTNMLDDFNGTEGRPGVARRPGVMERLQTVEKSQLTMAAKVDVIHEEVNYNHGGSVKDAVDRIDSRLVVVESDVKGLHDRLDKQALP